MAFGQPWGPPATAKLLQQLLALLHEAGHTDFRDARGPMGFNQRQAGGKFTRDEAEALIEQLEADATPPEPPARPTADVPSPAAVKAAPRTAATSTEQALRTVPSTMLAAELQRRGWVVMEP